MFHSKLLVSAWAGVIACLVLLPSNSAITQKVQEGYVAALDNSIRLNLLYRITDKVAVVSKAFKKGSEWCEKAIESRKTACEACGKDCKKDMPKKVLENIVLAPFRLHIQVATAIFTNAPKILEKFGKDSYKYLQHVGNLAQTMGSTLLQGGDKLLQGTGKSFMEIGKQFEESSKKLLKDSEDGLRHASDQVVNTVKDTLKGIEKLGKPLLKETTKLFDDMGKIAGKGFENLGNSIGQISKSLLDGTKMIVDILKTNFNLPKIDLPKIDLPKIDLPKIDLPKIDLPKIDLPKIDFPKINLPQIDLPKINLPKIELPKISLPRLSLPRVNLPRFRIRLGWGKKKRILDHIIPKCDCPACDAFEDDPPAETITKRICGTSFFSNQTKQIKESQSLMAMYKFVEDNAVLTGILMDLASLRPTESSFFIDKATLMVMTPQRKTVELEMQNGMPAATLVGLTSKDMVKIVNEESPRVYDALYKSVSK